MTIWIRLQRLLLCALVVTSAGSGCGGDSGPAGPSGVTPTVTGISPASGPAAGGTMVTITGTNFSSPATVTVGQAAATSVTVVNGGTITAVTGARPAGAADVVVTAGGRTGTLRAAFTYVAGAAPVIQSVTAQGRRSGEPARFADLGEEIDVSVRASDPDTAAASLSYTWSAPAGSFSNTAGARGRWRAPQSFSTPGTVRLSVAVSDGALQTTGTVDVRLHDSETEVGDMARLFLEDFSRQALSPEEVVRNFTTTCSGTASELLDVRNNQRTHDILEWSVGAPAVTVRFGGTCPHRNRPGDACALLAVDWNARCINETRLNGDKVCDLGQTSRVRGTDQVTARYTGGRWWLCASDFVGSSTDTLTGRVSDGRSFKQ